MKKIFFVIMLLLSQANLNCQPELGNIEYIFNGDFEKGNVGFTTDYDYFFYLKPEGKYFIYDNPQKGSIAFDTCKNHTPGKDSMFVGNGFTAPDKIVWKQTVNNIVPYSDYFISIWFTGIRTERPAIFEVFINGKSIAPLFYLNYTTCEWQNFTAQWNADAVNTAEIIIYDRNLQTDGNDFAMDDISFKPVCSVKANAGKDRNICKGERLNIGDFATGYYPPFKYKWYDKNGKLLSDKMNPDIQPDETSEYCLVVTDGVDCIAYDTVKINVIESPEFEIKCDKKTIICPCDSLTLTASSTDPTLTYKWSTGETTNSIVVKNAGTYSVTALNQYNCYTKKDTTVAVFNVNTHISLGYRTCKIGDTIKFAMIVDSNFNRQLCGLNYFRAILKFNKSILTPVGSTPFGKIEGDEQIITIENNTLDSLLTELEFVATLGSDSCTNISFDLFKWNCENNVEIDTLHGRACITDYCNEPVPRFFEDTGVMTMKQLAPNPAQSSVKLHFNLIEKGMTEIFIINQLGEKVATCFKQFAGEGEYEINYPLYGIAPGSYYITLQTPTKVITQNLVIVK